MKVYVVVYHVGGYAREDAPRIKVLGVYDEESKAKILSTVCHGEYKEIEMNYIPPGYLTAAGQYGYNINNLLF